MGSLVPLSTALTNQYKSNITIYGGNYPVGAPIQNAEPNRLDPRTYQVTTGQNVIVKPKSEIPKATPYEVLDFVARSTDLIQIAENMLLNQISGRKWDIVPADPEDKNDYTEQIAKIKEFFKHPDKERTYSQWIRKALKNITRFDALTLYKRKDRSGKLYGLTVIDGSTIKVVTDSNGNKPIAPECCYQQIIYGTVRGSWTINDLIYAPMSEELVGNYGVGPVERILTATMKYLRKQQFDYSYYQEGAYPDGGLYALKPNDQSQWSADDIEKFTANWQDSMADYKNRQSLTFVPDGQLHKTKEYTWDTVQEEWFGRLVCTSFGVDPQTFAKQVNRAVADSDDRKQTETGLKPYIRHVEDILTDVTQTDLGCPKLAFKIIDEKLEDQKAKVDKNIKYIQSGIYNRNEVRKEEGKNPVKGGDEYTVQVGNALIPVENVGQMMTINPDSNNSEIVSKDTADNYNKNSKDSVAAGKQTENKKKDNPIVKKSLTTYKNFLIKRFKENRSLYGYSNDELPLEVIKTVEDELHNVQSLEDIINIFKVDSDIIKKYKIITNRIKNVVTKKFTQIKKQFVNKLEVAYLNKDINFIKSYNFISDLKDNLSEDITELTQLGREDALNLLNSKVPDENQLVLNYGEHEAAKRALTYTDKLVTEVNDATINFIQQTVSQAILNEKSWDWIKEQLMSNDYYAFSEKRAETIAKTEEARALNDGALNVWNDSGLVERVLLTDGDGCPTCEELNDTEVSLEWALDNLLEHPNCVREYFPIINNKLTNNGKEEDSDPD